eukprot:m.180871 g.180871  ORF g.180871 m.180871 type:complete len:306 (-) comp53449_c0_seq2:994-1911(-)
MLKQQQQEQVVQQWRNRLAPSSPLKPDAERTEPKQRFKQAALALQFTNRLHKQHMENAELKLASIKEFEEAIRNTAEGTRTFLAHELANALAPLQQPQLRDFLVKPAGIFSSQKRNDAALHDLMELLGDISGILSTLNADQAGLANTLTPLLLQLVQLSCFVPDGFLSEQTKAKLPVDKFGAVTIATAEQFTCFFSSFVLQEVLIKGVILPLKDPTSSMQSQNVMVVASVLGRVANQCVGIADYPAGLNDALLDAVQLKYTLARLGDLIRKSSAALVVMCHAYFKQLVEKTAAQQDKSSISESAA